MQRTLGGVAYLPQKIIAATLVLCMLPLAYLYYMNWAYYTPTPEEWVAGVDSNASTDSLQILNRARDARVEAPQATQEWEPSPNMVHDEKADAALSGSSNEQDAAARAAAGDPGDAGSMEALVVRKQMAHAGILRSADAEDGQPERTSFLRIHSEPAKTVGQSTLSRQRRRAEVPATARKRKAEPSRQVNRGEARSRASRAHPSAQSETAAAFAESQEMDAAGRRPKQLHEAAQSLTHFADTYRRSFERGDLSAFLSHLSPTARENNHGGPPWFRSTYGQLFQDTRARRFDLDVTKIAQEGDRWSFQANYRLELLYKDDRREETSGRAEYTVEHDGKSWKITRIRRSSQTRTFDKEPLIRFVESYRRSFEAGNLDAFLNHFSAAAQENSHSGIDWFRATYRKVFKETQARRFDLTIAKMSQQGNRWEVQGSYRLEFIYPDKRQARASGQIHYTVERQGDAWKIRRVRYREGGE